MCSAPSHLDLRNIEFEDFVTFLFDHPITEADPDSQICSPRWDIDFPYTILFDPERHAQHYIRLFSHPAFLIERFTDAQLDAGFGELTYRYGFEGNVSEIIWTKELGLDQREAVIRSMYFLFADLFAVRPLWSASFMWWDELAYCFHPDLLRDDWHPDNGFIREVMFSVLRDILDIPSEECRQAALHGLNHLRHPDTEAYVEAFLNSRSDLSPKLMKYARRCMTLDVE